MRFDIRIQKLDLHEELSRYIERRLRFSLSRLVSRLRVVNVRVFDVNGPRGGVDKYCRITAHLLPSETVVMQEVDADLFVAIDRATRRIARTFTRRLTLKRDLRKKSNSPRPDPPHSGENGISRAGHANTKQRNRPSPMAAANAFQTGPKGA